MTSAFLDDDLMDTLERILMSDASDLRELALIAKADPRTFYIGTALDGVDIRGQDLRGMLLPNLDPTKVRMDERTRLDASDPEDAQAPQGELEDIPNALVLIASHRLWRLIANQGHLTPNTRFYDLRSAAAFAEDCLAFPGAKLVICQRGLDEGWPWEGIETPGGILVLVYDRRLDRPTLAEREENVGYWQAPQVLVPTLREDRPATPTGPARFPTALRDAILYASADWNAVYEFAREMSFSVFLRASGTPTSPLAWVQLYSWAVTFGVDAERGLRMGLPRDRLGLPQPNYEDLIFDRLKWQDAELPPTAKFTAAALFGVEKRQFPKDSQSYTRTVARILEAQHWKVEALSGPSPTPLPRIRASSTVDAIDMRISGGDRAAKREVFAPSQMTLIHPELNPVVVSEAADTATVVSRLANYDELYVSVRDLVDLDARGATIWTLIASLTKRVGRSGDYAQRTQFLAMLTLRAVRRAGGEGAPPDVLEDYLLQPDFFQSHRLRVVDIKWRDGELSLTIAMIETDTSANLEMLRYRMVIGPSGPFLL